MRIPRSLDVWKLGIVNYLDALKLQEKLVSDRKANKISDTILSLQHPPTYTIGKRQTDHNLLVSESDLKSIGAELHYIQRGGDITFHGLHQAILYPIISLRDIGFGARKYVERLESTMIELASLYGVRANPGKTGETGVWVGNGKIGAIGVRISSGITSHGLAFNIDPDLDYFKNIVPCGIADKEVTSLRRETDMVLPSEEVIHEQLISCFVERQPGTLRRRGQQCSADLAEDVGLDCRLDCFADLEATWMLEGLAQADSMLTCLLMWKADVADGADVDKRMSGDWTHPSRWNAYLALGVNLDKKDVAYHANVDNTYHLTADWTCSYTWIAYLDPSVYVDNTCQLTGLNVRTWTADWSRRGQHLSDGWLDKTTWMMTGLYHRPGQHVDADWTWWNADMANCADVATRVLVTGLKLPHGLLTGFHADLVDADWAEPADLSATSLLTGLHPHGCVLTARWHLTVRNVPEEENKAWEEVLGPLLPAGAPLLDADHLGHSIAVEYNGPPTTYDLPTIEQLYLESASIRASSIASVSDANIAFFN
ncbi:hypothetical protein RJ641_011236 [Dillenia turbinata]|uniref:lipoyl(octanoyl) transferase n=1 Tax=Dillenia turbinata TaxID=194707 RepID=A0AAN8V971_9MAGN